MLKRILLLLLLTVAVAVGVHEGMFWYHHVHEANARVQANFTVLASNVNGKLVELHARRGEDVRKRQLLVSMDDRQARLAISTLEAELKRQKAVRSEIEAELKFFLTELEGKIDTARQETGLLKSTFETANERMSIARKNVERNSTLESRSIVARQRVDDANDRLLAMQERIREVHSEIKMSERRLTELERQRDREAVFRTRIDMVDRDLDKTAVELELARQRLDDMQLKSPLDGVVNRVYVNPGTYVEDGDPLILLHDPDELWIEAEVSESDIRLVSVGQRVIIELDAYPFEQFTGKVRTIGQVTVRQMANGEATGDANGVQRILVEIAMPNIGKAVWPGMRAAVNIVVR